MGACSIHVTATGMSMREAFNNAVEEAEQEHGHEQGYSGAINSCRLIKEVSKGDYTENEILERTDKREVWGYCEKEPMKNLNKIRSVVESFPQKGTRKWKTVYNVETFEGIINSWDSQTEAIKNARIYTEGTQKRTSVVISKQLVGSHTKCASITYKKSGKEQAGVYVFIGMAPE